MKTHLENKMTAYPACGKNTRAVMMTNNVAEVDCGACENSVYFKNRKTEVYRISCGIHTPELVTFDVEPCFICGAEPDREAESSYLLAADLHTQGWRDHICDHLQTQGLMCPDCVAQHQNPSVQGPKVAEADRRFSCDEGAECGYNSKDYAKNDTHRI